MYPQISLNFSSNHVRIGSSVNVTCTAVSYPLADPETDYIIQHPTGLAVVHTYIAPGMDGVIHEIERVTDEDGGEYNCHVILNNYISSETEAHLTISKGKLQCMICIKLHGVWQRSC